MFFNPLVLRTLPLYSLTETPRNATGHGRGRGLEVVFQFRYKDTLCTSPLCFVAQNIGEKQRSDSDEEGDWKDDMPRIV